jgi:hypothetical protein
MQNTNANKFTDCTRLDIDLNDRHNRELMTHVFAYIYEAVRISYITVQGVDYYTRKDPNYNDQKTILTAKNDEIEYHLKFVEPRFKEFVRNNVMDRCVSDLRYWPRIREELLSTKAENDSPLGVNEKFVIHGEEYDEDTAKALCLRFADTVESLLNKLFNLDPNNVTFKGFDKVILENARGPSDDSRGANHLVSNLGMDFDFHEQYEVPLKRSMPDIKNIQGGQSVQSPSDAASSFTLVDLAKAAYKIKHKKFDNWYELYQGCTCQVENGTLRMLFKFDHGS